VSLGLDEELSELERRLLDAHLARCVDCSAFASHVRQVVAELRSTPDEPVPAGFDVAGWHRRPAPVMRMASRVAAVAAAAAAGVAMFSLGAGTVGERQRQVAVAPSPIILDATSTESSQEVAEFRSARRAILLSLIPNEPENGMHSGPTPL
jgi:anti-sigma factor RsiW